MATSIKIGNVNVTPDTSIYDNSGSARGIFTDYVIHNRYMRSKHCYMLGVSSPDGFQGASVSFAQIASPTLLWVSDWTACRYDEFPEIPSPVSQDPNWILLDEGLVLPDIDVAGDGTPIFRLTGCYVYGHRNPADKLTADACMGRPPWLKDVFARKVPDNKVKQGIISVVGTQAGGGPARDPSFLKPL